MPQAEHEKSSAGVEIWLLRHAKSSLREAGQKDHERPLAPRGRKAAPQMGVVLRERGLIPELVLCSTALRTRQTWELVQEALGTPVTTSFMDRLYDAGPAQLLTVIRGVEEGIRHLLLVGHNPGLQELALQLAGSGSEADLDRLRNNLPTAGFVRLAFDEARWRDVRPGGGCLMTFLAPREL
jgi:phosphohistidine phosphatase